MMGTFTTSALGQKINMDMVLENNILLLMIPLVHVCPDHLKAMVQGIWGLYLVWNGATADTNNNPHL